MAGAALDGVARDGDAPVAGVSDGFEGAGSAGKAVLTIRTCKLVPLGISGVVPLRMTAVMPALLCTARGVPDDLITPVAAGFSERGAVSPAFLAD